MPGPLNIGIIMNSTDDCVVSRKEPQSNSPLQVGDILLSLNDITLRDVEGGTDAWCKLFSAFNTGERKVKVQRDAAGNDSVNSQFIKSEKNGNESSEDSMQVNTANKKRKADKNDINKSNMKVVSLLDDSDDEDDIVKVEQKESSHNVGALHSRSNMSILDDDIEIMEVSPATAATSSASSSTSSRRGNLKDDRNYEDTNMDNSGDNNKDGDEDEELVVVASRGQNALADFPHVSMYFREW